uniref:Uncharacterized protein n=1 Tax=Candidatus Kentrum sp. UNK TaxID=2126344 RepID=A0A451AK39_9GAMM|nr:MAG: hypothetical protein BECKUNK1418G_GA0071005_10918 [Candidatus Kentron sp. UNK]VFK71439.1 MAG: hypothetical protein BECKUNK1418H_GA0071006_10668 [Candidatus Kentron sp. UNK]
MRTLKPTALARNANIRIGKIKIPKNRCLRKEHPVWILARSANMFVEVIGKCPNDR